MRLNLVNKHRNFLNQTNIIKLYIKLINQLNHCKTIVDLYKSLIIFLTFPRKNHLFVTDVSYILLNRAVARLQILGIQQEKRALMRSEHTLGFLVSFFSRDGYI